MNYEIPKEIRSKPRIMGLEMRELIILLIGFFSIFTVLKDMVHSVFLIPYFIISSLFVMWAVIPSPNNPTMKNYMSVLLFLKHNRQTYHALDVHKTLNQHLYNEINETNDTEKGG